MMTPKHKRIIERDVECLFSLEAFMVNPTGDDFKRNGFMRPYITVNRRTIFLSDKAIAALDRLTDVIARIPSVSGVVSRNEIHGQVVKNFSNWLESLLQPTGQEFIDRVIEDLLRLVKEYHFLARIEGISFADKDVFELGSSRILRSNPAVLNDMKFGGNIDFASVYENFKDSLWLICTSRGSPDVATEQFELRATLTIGVLAVAGALLYKGAIWRTWARVVISPLQHRARMTVLRWDVGGDNPSVAYNWGGEQDLAFKPEMIAHLNQHCFLTQLASLQERPDRSQVEDAIIRSLYWFADAYRDRNPTMQFIKLWSCVECFFAIDKEQITELNARGMAVMLTFVLSVNPAED
jgi:hypothetical protein